MSSAAWISILPEAEVSGGRLGRTYEQLRQAAGHVANILQVHSLTPQILDAHLALYTAAVHTPGELSRLDREMIAVAVSRTNGCHY